MAKQIFEPCRKARKRNQAEHAFCVGALFDANGERVVCDCPCHRESELFAEHRVVSVQRDLFENWLSK